MIFDICDKGKEYVWSGHLSVTLRVYVLANSTTIFGFLITVCYLLT